MLHAQAGSFLYPLFLDSCMRYGILLVMVFLLAFATGCTEQPRAIEEPTTPPQEPPSSEGVEEELRPLPPEQAPSSAVDTTKKATAERMEEKEEGLPPGFARLTLADPDNPIEIISWGIEQGSSGSAKLMNVTFIVRNTGREPFTGKVLFEAWEENIFLKKTWDIGAIIPPGQSYTLTEYVDVTLDAPKQQKQMRAVLIVTKGLAVSGEDHKFFVPIKR